MSTEARDSVRAQLHALREVYDPIDTEPGELDEAKHETEGGALMIAGAVIGVLLVALAVWWWRTHAA